MDREAWWATVYGGHKELDMTEHTQKFQRPLEVDQMSANHEQTCQQSQLHPIHQLSLV